MAAPTAADIITQIDETIFALVTDGASSKSFMGKNYTVLDLNALKELRSFYSNIDSETTQKRPVVSSVNFGCTGIDYPGRTW